MGIRLLIASLMIGAGAVAAQSAEISVLSTPTMQSTLNDLASPFEQKTGHKLVLRFDGVPVLKKQIEGGEAFDVTILLPAAVDDLARQGKVAVGTRADIARTAAGIAIRAGATKPNIATIEGLKKTLLAAASISYSPDSASGSYFLTLLRKLGIEEETKSKLKSVTGRSPVDAVAKGEAELTVITVPNIVGIHGVELGGLLPEEVQNYTTFSAGISAGTKDAKAGEALVSFLRSPAAASAMRTYGLEALTP